MSTLLNLNLNFELLLAAFALVILLVMVTVALAWHYVHAWRNTPLAADDVALESRIRQKQEQIADLDTAIAEREHNLRHREDAEAEVGVRRDLKAGLVHEHEQPERLQNDRLATRVRPRNDQRVGVGDVEIERHDVFVSLLQA